MRIFSGVIDDSGFVECDAAFLEKWVPVVQMMK